MKKIILLVLALLIAGPVFAGDIVRTPDERFQNLQDWPYEPNYLQVGELRIHYVDEGPKDGQPVLLLHGEPSWAYLYRKMIPTIAAAGYRVIVPDLVGFGRSDKYTNMEDYTFQMQVDVMHDVVNQLDLQDAVFFGQDWGGLIGLRVVAEQPDRFAAVMISNTGLPLPAPDDTTPLPFRLWQWYAKNLLPTFGVGSLINQATVSDLSDEVKAAYDAPFPDKSYMAGARIMPTRVPANGDDVEVPDNAAAWAVYRQWNKPFLTAFSDSDPVTRGQDKNFLDQVPGTKGQPHTTIKDGGHFVQEDKGEELAELMVRWLADQEK